MKHLIIFLIIIIGILLIKCSTVETFVDIVTDKYIVPDINIKYSYQIESNGGFSNKKINKGDIIEVCPIILEKTIAINNTEKLKNYHFNYDNEKSAIALGYCSMYNHSDTPNASWVIIDETSMKIQATTDIESDEEILVSYGNEYWNTRKDLLKK